jgi:hypothetical protein
MSESVTSDAVDAFSAEANVVPTVVDASESTIVPSPKVETSTNKFYTEEDLAKVRSQEKDKLYPQIEKLKEELDFIKKEKEAEIFAKAAQEAVLADEAKRKQEEELEVRELLKLKEEEFTQQLEREREERERAFALLEREKTFAELQSYRQTRIEQERENIIPELIELINGNTPEEIEASIQGLKAKTSSILDNVQQATQAARRDMTGTRVTTPPSAGPLDIETGTRQFTAQDISSMSLTEYAKFRDNLLSPQARGVQTGQFG